MVLLGLLGLGVGIGLGLVFRVGVRVSINIKLFALYFIHRYSVDGATGGYRMRTMNSDFCCLRAHDGKQQKLLFIVRVRTMNSGFFVPYSSCERTMNITMHDEMLPTTINTEIRNGYLLVIIMLMLMLMYSIYPRANLVTELRRLRHEGCLQQTTELC